MKNKGEIEEKLYHTSEVFFTLGARNSVSQREFLNQGLNPEEFQRLFWQCKVGGPDLRESDKKDVLHLYSLLTNRFVIWLEVEEK